MAMRLCAAGFHRVKSEMKQPTACVVAGTTGLPARTAAMRVSEIVTRRRGTLETEIHEAIVDPAAIEHVTAGDDRDFRRDRGADEVDQRVLRIAKSLRDGA